MQFRFHHFGLSCVLDGEVLTDSPNEERRVPEEMLRVKVALPEGKALDSKLELVDVPTGGPAGQWTHLVVMDKDIWPVYQEDILP
jgi:hypothetical protein